MLVLHVVLLLVLMLPNNEQDMHLLVKLPRQLMHQHVQIMWVMHSHVMPLALAQEILVHSIVVFVPIIIQLQQLQPHHHLRHELLVLMWLEYLKNGLILVMVLVCVNPVKIHEYAVVYHSIPLYHLLVSV